MNICNFTVNIEWATSRRIDDVKTNTIFLGKKM